MRAVVQRVRESHVEVKGETVGRIGKGLLVFLGVGQGDTEEDCRYLAKKICSLRIFPDDQGKMNLAVAEAGGEVLVVSQFTLWGDCRKGRRPSFSKAASPDVARKLYGRFVGEVSSLGLRVATGIFQEMMDVHLVSDGPVTLMLDSQKNF